MLFSVGASRSTASPRLVRTLKVSGLAAPFAAGVLPADAIGAGAKAMETTTTVPTAVEPTTASTTVIHDGDRRADHDAPNRPNRHYHFLVEFGQRDAGERLLVSVDQAGRVSTLPLPSQRES